MRYVIVLAAVCFAALGTNLRADEPRAGQVISLDMLVADVGAAALGEGEVTAVKILELAAQSKVDAATRVQLSVLENTPGVATFSETAPVATGRQEMAGFPGGGRGANLFSNQNHGTTVQATGRVEQDGTIVLELQAERSRLIANRPAGEEGAAASVAANKTVQIRVNTTTRLASGKPTIVGSQATGVGKDAIHTYIVLTASAAEGGKAAAASDAKLNFFTLANARAGDISKVLREALTSMPFTIAADERSNSLIVSGPPDVLEIIRNLVARLDEAK
jgi:type II secretory pathway component GspD/PulD (secretin)